MAEPLKIQALLLLSIQEATRRYQDGGTLRQWEQDMRNSIARGHTTAYLLGIAERLGVPVDSALVSERRLSRAERNELKVHVKAQLAYLEKFLADVQAGHLSPAQVAARAAMYSGATRGTYSQARWTGIPLPFHPTEGSECRANCRCVWDVRQLDGSGNADAIWILGPTELHCRTCPSRASASPYRIRNGVLQ